VKRFYLVTITMAVVATTLSLLGEPRTLPSSGLISRVANCCQVSTVETICFPRYRGDNNVNLFGNLSQYLLNVCDILFWSPIVISNQLSIYLLWLITKTAYV
jgi:hypothetical protein